MPLPAWLPELIELPAHGGDWGAYLEAVYKEFCKGFRGAAFEFRGKRVGLKRYPVIDGKEATFWHFISQGNVEEDRVPDIRRCERIGWARAILDNVEDEGLLVWTEEVKGDQRILIWCEDASYLVVLADRGEYVLPWTAYPVEHEHQKRKLRNRHAAAQK